MKCEHCSRKLSSAETEIVKLYADGFSTKEIADRRKVSVKTVDNQKVRLKRKIAARSPADLVKYAIRHGLTTVGEDPVC